MIIKCIIILSLLFILIFTNKKLYIYKSNIHKDGLFTKTNLKKNNIIIKNLFPNKDKHKKFLYPELPDIINKSISYEAKYINHCENNYNCDIITQDHKKYTLIAIKDIHKNSELTVNYDLVNSKYPFIDKAYSWYNKC